MKILSVTLLLSSSLQDAKCLASSQHRRVIVSIKRNGGESKIFDPSPDVHKYQPPLRPRLTIRGLKEKIVSVVYSTFLPSGYPTKTPPGYLRYCMYSWIQDTSTQLRSVLATQKILEGVGVGQVGATTISALMNYLIRDGCGMFASLFFTSITSSRFRTDIKRWRLFADMMVDIGITLEIMAVLVPSTFFLPMISIGNMCKAICGVAAGACSGSINLHWSKGSDLSDINAKFGAQHTVTGALGLIFAACFAKSVNNVNTTFLWILYTTLTIAHLVANARCMRLITFDSCNTLRMNMLLTEFFEWWNTDDDKSEFPRLSSPEQIAQKEPLFFGHVKKVAKGPCGGLVPIHVGISFDEFWKLSLDGQNSNDPVTNHLESSEHTHDNYLVTYSVTRPGVAIAFLTNATGRQEAKAYFHATWLGSSKMMASRGQQQGDDDFSHAWECFEKSMIHSGWNLEKTELDTQGYEIQFMSQE